MNRKFEDTENNRFYTIELDFDADSLTITSGELGSEGETEFIEDAFASHDMPAEILMDLLIYQLDPSFEEVLPDDLLELVEENHEVELSGRLRRFYGEQEYKRYQDMICAGLDCRVNFIANAVLGVFIEEFYDTEKEEFVELIPISSMAVGEFYNEVEEQSWIGVDPALEDGPVYQLFTSNAFEVAYANLDAFLEDLAVGS